MSSAFAAPAECEREISKSCAKFTQAKMKAVGHIEPGEACELPQIGGGLLQGWLACQACVP